MALGGMAFDTAFWDGMSGEWHMKMPSESQMLEESIKQLEHSMRWWKTPSSKREIRGLIEQRKNELALVKLKN